MKIKETKDLVKPLTDQNGYDKKKLYCTLRSKNMYKTFRNL